MYSTAQSVIPFSFDGKQFYTHTSWLSQRQYRAFHNIPAENDNLAFYYGLSTVACAAILLRKSSLLRPFSGSYAKVITGLGGGSIAGYFLWLSAFRSQESSELSSLVARNDNNCLPLWSKQEEVVNLREKNYKVFMQRRQHGQFKPSDVKVWNPDGVLMGKQGSQSVETL